MNVTCSLSPGVPSSKSSEVGIQHGVATETRKWKGAIGGNGVEGRMRWKGAGDRKFLYFNKAYFFEVEQKKKILALHNLPEFYHIPDYSIGENVYLIFRV